MDLQAVVWINVRSCWLPPSAIDSALSWANMRTIVESASLDLAIKFVQSITIRWPGVQALHPFFAFLLSAALRVLSLAADPRPVAEAAADRKSLSACLP